MLHAASASLRIWTFVADTPKETTLSGKQTLGRSGDSHTDGEPAEVGIRLLGRFAVTVDGRRIDQWRRRTAELVQLLALSPGHRMGRQSVVAELWPHLPEDRGVANLHKTAHQVRCSTGCEDAIVLDEGHVWLWPVSTVKVDLVELERDASRVLATLDREQCGVLADRCAAALAPTCRFGPRAEEADGRLDQLRRQLLHAAGRFRDAIAFDPSDEDAHRALMRAALDRDDHATALAHYRDLCARLADLDLRPAPETVALYNEAVAAGQRRTVPSRPPLVGCDNQVRQARRRLRHAACGEGGCVLVRGPSRAGATRLALEITDEATDAGFTVLRAATVPSSALPDGPVTTAVRDLLSSRPELAVTLPPSTRRALEQLTGHRTEDRAHPPAPATAAVAVRDLLMHAAGFGASVLLIDGVEDVDPDTAALLGDLADAIRFAPVMVVFTLTPADGLPSHVRQLVGRLLSGTGCTDLPIATRAAALTAA